jgi:hypothetical protein
MLPCWPVRIPRDWSAACTRRKHQATVSAYKGGQFLPMGFTRGPWDLCESLSWRPFCFQPSWCDHLIRRSPAMLTCHSTRPRMPLFFLALLPSGRGSLSAATRLFFFVTLVLERSIAAYSDSTSGRVLSANQAQLSDQTIETCTAACQAAGYVSHAPDSWHHDSDNRHSRLPGPNTRSSAVSHHPPGLFRAYS